MKNRINLGIAGLIWILCITTLYLFHPFQVNSAPPTNVKDTLSTSQLSFFARLGSGNTYLDTTVRLTTTGNNPSKNTHNLFIGDTVAIGRGTTLGMDLFVVADIGNTANFQVTAGLGGSNAVTDNMVIATRSAIHTVSFTPKSSIAGGKWQFLIRATNSAIGTSEYHNDGIPDRYGFDLGSTHPGVGSTGIGTRLTAADISCPFGATASVGTTTVVSGNSYHIITCALSAGATNPINVGVTWVIGRALNLGSQLINPSAAVGHVEGTADGSADVYNFFIRHTDSSDVVVDADTAQGAIAVVEAVRVTATIDPTITFSIDNTGVASGQILCGQTMASNADNVTATTVPFGTLGIGSFNNLAQRLSAVTNAAGGYVVTVYEDSKMHLVSNIGTTFADTNCDGACNYTTNGEWVTDKTSSEWGYSLQNTNVGVSLFNYNNGGANFSAKAFGIGTTSAQEIMKNTSTPTTTERAYICYRLTASTAQPAGNYENKLVFTATATF